MSLKRLAYKPGAAREAAIEETKAIISNSSLQRPTKRSRNEQPAGFPSSFHTDDEQEEFDRAQHIHHQQHTQVHFAEENGDDDIRVHLERQKQQGVHAHDISATLDRDYDLVPEEPTNRFYSSVSSQHYIHPSDQQPQTQVNGHGVATFDQTTTGVQQHQQCSRIEQQSHHRSHHQQYTSGSVDRHLVRTRDQPTTQKVVIRNSADLSLSYPPPPRQSAPERAVGSYDPYRISAPPLAVVEHQRDSSSGDQPRVIKGVIEHTDQTIIEQIEDTEVSIRKKIIDCNAPQQEHELVGSEVVARPQDNQSTYVVHSHNEHVVQPHQTEIVQQSVEIQKLESIPPPPPPQPPQPPPVHELRYFDELEGQSVSRVEPEYVNPETRPHRSDSKKEQQKGQAGRFEEEKVDQEESKRELVEEKQVYTEESQINCDVNVVQHEHKTNEVIVPVKVVTLKHQEHFQIQEQTEAPKYFEQQPLHVHPQRAEQPPPEPAPHQTQQHDVTRHTVDITYPKDLQPVVHPLPPSPKQDTIKEERQYSSDPVTTTVVTERIIEEVYKPKQKVEQTTTETRIIKETEIDSTGYNKSSPPVREKIGHSTVVVEEKLPKSTAAIVSRPSQPPPPPQVTVATSTRDYSEYLRDYQHQHQIVQTDLPPADSRSSSEQFTYMHVHQPPSPVHHHRQVQTIEQQSMDSRSSSQQPIGSMQIYQPPSSPPQHRHVQTDKVEVYQVRSASEQPQAYQPAKPPSPSQRHRHVQTIETRSSSQQVIAHQPHKPKPASPKILHKRAQSEIVQSSMPLMYSHENLEPVIQPTQQKVQIDEKTEVMMVRSSSMQPTTGVVRVSAAPGEYGYSATFERRHHRPSHPVDSGYSHTYDPHIGGSVPVVTHIERIYDQPPNEQIRFRQRQEEQVGTFDRNTAKRESKKSAKSPPPPPHHRSAVYESEVNEEIHKRKSLDPYGTIERQLTLEKKQAKHRRSVPAMSHSAPTSAKADASFQKCSVCNKMIFGNRLRCATCNRLAHTNEKCSHVSKRERSRAGFSWYCSPDCILTMQQALPFFGSIQKLGAHPSQLHVAAIDVGSLLSRKFTVWTMLAQEQYDALVVLNATLPKKADAQHLKFAGYALYFDESRRNAIYAKADLRPRRFVLEDNKSDVLKLNGGTFDTIIVGFQQRAAATVVVMSRPKNADDHGRFRERLTDWLTRLLWQQNEGWEDMRSLAPQVSARRLVLFADVNINPPYREIKANRKTSYFRYIKPIEQRFRLRQHMTRENSRLGQGKLCFTGDQFRLTRCGFEQMFDEKRPAVMVNKPPKQTDEFDDELREEPKKLPKFSARQPLLFWAFLSTSKGSSATGSLRRSSQYGSASSTLMSVDKAFGRSRSVPPDYYLRRAGASGMAVSGTNTMDSQFSRDSCTNTPLHHSAYLESNDFGTLTEINGEIEVEHSRFADIRELREQVDRLASAYERNAVGGGDTIASRGSRGSHVTTSSTMTEIATNEPHTQLHSVRE